MKRVVSRGVVSRGLTTTKVGEGCAAGLRSEGGGGELTPLPQPFSGNNFHKRRGRGARGVRLPQHPPPVGWEGRGVKGDAFLGAPTSEGSNWFPCKLG